jgi:hypothetical protein
VIWRIFKTNYKINVVDIVGMEYMSDSQMSGLVERLSKSANIITLHTIRSHVLHFDDLKGNNDRIIELSERLLFSEIVVANSREAILHDCELT